MTTLIHQQCLERPSDVISEHGTFKVCGGSDSDIAFGEDGELRLIRMEAFFGLKDESLCRKPGSLQYIFPKASFELFLSF